MRNLPIQKLVFLALISSIAPGATACVSTTLTVVATHPANAAAPSAKAADPATVLLDDGSPKVETRKKKPGGGHMHHGGGK